MSDQTHEIPILKHRIYAVDRRGVEPSAMSESMLGADATGDSKPPRKNLKLTKITGTSNTNWVKPEHQHVLRRQEDARQRPAEHIAHRNVEQRHREDERDDKAVQHALCSASAVAFGFSAATPEPTATPELVAAPGPAGAPAWPFGLAP